MVSSKAAEAGSRRQPALRGDGGRLRQEIIDAGELIVDRTADPRVLTLRGLAREVGIATTSVYLHFSDVDSLKIVLVERFHAELTAVRDDAAVGVVDPVKALVARCVAFCAFGVEYPGRYRLMFREDIPTAMGTTPGPTPGGIALASLAAGIARCKTAGRSSARDDAHDLAVLVWVALHGLVTLRIERPSFPLPALERAVEQILAKIAGVDTARPAYT